MCRALRSGICSFKLSAPVTARWLNASFTLSVEVGKTFCVAAAPSCWAGSPSPADGIAQQVQGHLAPLPAGWEGAGTLSCLLCNGNERQGDTRGTSQLVASPPCKRCVSRVSPGHGSRSCVPHASFAVCKILAGEMRLGSRECGSGTAGRMAGSTGACPWLKYLQSSVTFPIQR